MQEHIESPTEYAWVVYAIATLIVGGLGGYILSVQTIQPPAQAAAQTSGPASATIVNEAELGTYRNILARDPKNLDAAVKAGNLLYDARRYVEAIAFYQQAFAVNSSDINVSTDLGTALWYAGRADEALVQYQKSLAINPKHGQTLFNIGIVRADGRRDYSGAVTAWEMLLTTNPQYPDIPRVRTLIADARQKAPVTR